MSQLYSKHTANDEKLHPNTYARAKGLRDAGWHLYIEQMTNVNIGHVPVPNLSEIHENIKAHALSKLKPVLRTQYYDKCRQKLQQVKYIF
jgi:hypothetical protein